MIKIFEYTMLFCISFSLILSNVSYAGEVVSAGTKLEQDSYVFSIPEATALMDRLKELEAKELELEKYKELEEVRVNQIDLYKLNESFYSVQIERYQQLDLTNQTLIQKYQKRERLQGIENVGFFVLGMAVTFGSISAANAIVSNQSNNFQASF